MNNKEQFERQLDTAVGLLWTPLLGTNAKICPVVGRHATRYLLWQNCVRQAGYGTGRKTSLPSLATGSSHYIIATTL